MQYDSDWVSGHFTRTSGGNTITFDVSAFCSIMWTEGISGWISSALFTFTNLYINGQAALVVDNTFMPETESCGIGCNVTKQVIVESTYNVRALVEVQVFCDEYGVLSIYATDFQIIHSS